VPQNHPLISKLGRRFSLRLDTLGCSGALAVFGRAIALRHIIVVLTSEMWLSAGEVAQQPCLPGSSSSAHNQDMALMPHYINFPTTLTHTTNSGLLHRRANRRRSDPRRPSAMAAGSPADWALESPAIVRTRVYRLPASREITASCIESARAVIRTRLAQSGARLAWLLNKTFH
jgi:hypothetical protein